MNTMHLNFCSKLENESFARTSVIAFLMPLNLSMEAVMEIKTVLAEAVVNAMIHGYEESEGIIYVDVSYDTSSITIIVKDDGKGIEDIEQALQPLYTSKELLERSGMGMTIMQTFADEFKIESNKGQGTKVTILKNIQHGNEKSE